MALGATERQILKVFKNLVDNDIQTGLGVSGLGTTPNEQMIKAITNAIMMNNALNNALIEEELERRRTIHTSYA